jgi:hypothetical protein
VVFDVSGGHHANTATAAREKKGNRKWSRTNAAAIRLRENMKALRMLGCYRNNPLISRCAWACRCFAR